jgi:hypothetical protein
VLLSPNSQDNRFTSRDLFAPRYEAASRILKTATQPHPSAPRHLVSYPMIRELTYSVHGFRSSVSFSISSSILAGGILRRSLFRPSGVSI